MCVYIYMYISSLSSCHATSMNLLGLFSLPISIIHRSWEVFQATSYILTELLYVGSSWSSCICSSMWGSPQEYVTNKFVSTFPAASRMSGSSNLDSFRDGRSVAVQLVLCWVLPPGLVQYYSLHSCVVAVKLFLPTFCDRPCSASTQQYRHDHSLKKKLRFILSVRSDFHMTDSLSIAVHAFVTHVWMSISVDETLLPRLVNLSTSFRELPFCAEILPLWLKHMYSVLCAFSRRRMPAAARSRLCSRVSTWAGVFARSSMSSA